MKHLYKIVLLVTLTMLVSCAKNKEAQEQPINPKTPVQVVTVQSGSIDSGMNFLGTTVYLKRNVVSAPIPSYIVQVNVNLGDQIHKGDILYVLQSKESRALGNDTSEMTSDLKGFGMINVKASASGIITTLDRQQIGEYILEGTQLCSIAASSDLAFQVNVPFEYIDYTKNHSCTITLPDHTEHTASFTRSLSTMNVQAQTQTVLAKSHAPLFLPENMIVQVAVTKQANDNHMLLPKSCVDSNEMMTEFWVMKVTNDSTAVKVPVTVGQKNASFTEIISPVFKASDRIISEGNYGMGATARIQIMNK